MTANKNDRTWEEEMQRMRALHDQARARWEIERAALPDNGEDHDTTKPKKTSAIASANTDAWLQEVIRLHAEHRATCRSRECARCDRYFCDACNVVRVTKAIPTCVGCRFIAGARNMRIPERHRGAILGAIDVISSRVRRREAIGEIARSLLAHALVLRGPAGSGKSTLLAAGGRGAYALSFAFDPSTRPPLWASAIDLGLARSEHKLGAPTPPLLQEAKRTPLLLLDDLGAEPAHHAAAIAETIHARHDKHLRTWISTALSAREIGQRYSGGIERRVYEKAVRIECGGRSNA
jgi:hypothetical protein